MIWEKTIKEEWTNKNYSNDDYSYICSQRLFEYLPVFLTGQRRMLFSEEDEDLINMVEKFRKVSDSVWVSFEAVIIENTLKEEWANTNDFYDNYNLV